MKSLIHFQNRLNFNHFHEYFKEKEIIVHGHVSLTTINFNLKHISALLNIHYYKGTEVRKINKK